MVRSPRSKYALNAKISAKSLAMVKTNRCPLSEKLYSPGKSWMGAKRNTIWAGSRKVV
jgi:hypothetical protein